MNEKGYTLEGPQATASFTHWIDQKCRHEQANGDTDGDLNHGSCDVENNGVQTIG